MGEKCWEAMGKLTAAGIEALSKPGLHDDGGTLYLNVAADGSKSWIQRLTVGGRRRDIGLGGWQLVSLAEAREKAFENRKLARAGGDLLAEKRRRRTPTFREAAERTFEAHKPRWRNGQHTRNWMGSLEKHAFPTLGDTPVGRIGQEDVLGCLGAHLGREAGDRPQGPRQRISAVLRWGMADGLVEINVAGELIDRALPSMPAVREHFRSLPYHCPTLPVIALPRRPRGATRRRGVRGVAGGAAVLQVRGSDRGKKRRGSGCNLARDRHRCTGVADTRLAYEGRVRASPVVVRRSAGHVGGGPESRRWQRADFPEPSAARQAPERHGDDGAPPRRWTCGTDDDSRSEKQFQDLGL